MIFIGFGRMTRTENLSNMKNPRDNDAIRNVSVKSHENPTRGNQEKKKSIGGIVPLQRRVSGIMIWNKVKTQRGRRGKS